MLSMRSTLATIALFLAVSAMAADEPRSPDPLFLDTEVLEVRLTAPINTLLAKRPVDEELPGSFEFVNEAGDAVKLDVKIRTRGRFRRDEDNCVFPPIRLNFKASETKGTLFHKQNKVKLVTHCESSSKYEEALFSEYAAYRLLNVITDQSFRVRLLKITYIDSDENKADSTQYAFIIEHRDRLAKRMDKSVLEIPTTSSRALDPEYSSLVWLFQYMIGNTDFSPLRSAKGEMCCHNHVLFANEGEKIWSIPYDFDQSGLVDAPYALPAPQFRIRSVRQRLYRGRCVHNDYIGTAVARYQEQRESIMSVFDEIDMASERNIKKMKAYVEKFYDVLDSERRVENEFIKSCK
jgi:hypothetical protein